jgi:hypothetical protein
LSATGKEDIKWGKVLNLPAVFDIDPELKQVLGYLFSSIFLNIAQREESSLRSFGAKYHFVRQTLGTLDPLVDLLITLISELPQRNPLLENWEALDLWTQYKSDEPAMEVTPAAAMQAL